MKEFIVNIFLLWGSIQDLRTKKISSYYINIGWLLGVISVIISICNRNFDWRKGILSLLPGILFLIIAKVTKEQLGCGDGCVLLILAMMLQDLKVWIIMEMAVVFSGIFSVFMMIFQKKDKKSTFPFLPFLWISHVLIWGIN